MSFLFHTRKWDLGRNCGLEAVRIGRSRFLPDLFAFKRLRTQKGIRSTASLILIKKKLCTGESFEKITEKSIFSPLRPSIHHWKNYQMRSHHNFPWPRYRRKAWHPSEPVSKWFSPGPNFDKNLLNALSVKIFFFGKSRVKVERGSETNLPRCFLRTACPNSVSCRRSTDG